MPNPSTSAKNRYNASHYTQVKVSVCPDTATAFKAACAAKDTSMAAVLSKFMTDYIHAPTMNRPSALYDTRRNRRRTVKRIISQMEQLMLAEERFRDNIPENLQGAKWYDAAEQSIAVMQEIIDLLAEIY